MARFMRKHPDTAGVAYVVTKENSDGSLETVKVEGRDIYETDSKRVIELLKQDENFVEVNGETVIEPKNGE